MRRAALVLVVTAILCSLGAISPAKRVPLVSDDCDWNEEHLGDLYCSSRSGSLQACMACADSVRDAMGCDRWAHFLRYGCWEVYGFKP